MGRGEWAGPQPMPMPSFDYPQWDDPEFEIKIEQFGHDMEKWGKDWEKWGEKWGEQWAEHAREQAEQAQAHAEQGRAHALAAADAARFAPEVVHSCGEGERGRAITDDGRPRVVICKRDIERMARSSLRFARNSIAGNPEISDAVRREVLADLDEEIERLEREGD
jgi:bla regulator protein BlaR1